MSIEYAILGLLSIRPLSGYDIKKIMQESSFLYWSGNNNQIYKALTKLREEGCVDSQTVHEEESPTKKIYSITEYGRAELHGFALTEPEVPEMKKLFLVQLAFAASLSKNEMETIFDRYERNIRGAMMIERERNRQKRSFFSQQQTPLQSAIWEAVNENINETYANELAWIERTRQKVLLHAEQRIRPTKAELRYDLKKTHDQSYIRLRKDGGRIVAEEDALKLLGFCAEHESNLILIPQECLSDDFKRVSTGLAGSILQKLNNYNIRIAIVSEEEEPNGSFLEMFKEARHSGLMDIFNSEAEAVGWLIGRKRG